MVQNGDWPVFTNESMNERIKISRGLIAVLAFLGAASAVAGASWRLKPLWSQGPGAKHNPVQFDRADNWNYPNINYFRYARLKGSSAPLRYADGSVISENGDYRLSSNWEYHGAPSDHPQYGEAGEIRLDAHEVLETKHGRLFLHKGGQGYAQASNVPYGHVLESDLQFPDLIDVHRPRELPPEYGIPSLVPGTRYEWDHEKRNGRGCEPVDDPQFHLRFRIRPMGTPDALPEGWQYKPGEEGAPYFAKYADAGSRMGEGTEPYAYLLWSWLHRGDGRTTSPGGGMVRALIKDGQHFLRCPIQQIDSIAYGRNSNEEVGRVTAVYGKTRASENGPWIYGWAVYSHQAKKPDGSYGEPVYHMEVCLDC